MTTRYVYRYPVKQEPILSRVFINGERFMFMRWPEGEWLASVDSMVRADEGRSAFIPPEAA